ncbi:MAG: CDP-glycerol glycerophosphotransferase family protein [Firmicutes bacterium]|nr:CDP-glycerol glycerophosphotransferase family protein [Bacillota bacterium]
MRKIQQKQIFDTLEIIKESQISQNYADCQNGALALCDFIENITKTGTKTVNLLEKYCELLFNANNGNIGETALQLHFNSIVKSAQDELQPKSLEIAFISHMSAMSDTMETIYKAAKADSNCDAYWIPVPYYEVAPTGEITEKLFEPLDNYSDDFELVDWQTYNLEMRQPDVIFHCNLYNENARSYVIHSNFSRATLRKFTNLLIYVPYFAQDSLLDSPESMTLDYQSHKIIVPSQKAQQEYIFANQQLMAASNVEHFEQDISNPNRFVVLGSPKYDKVLISKREQFALPTEWLNIIQNKKIILYNTTLQSMGENTDTDYFMKINIVLSFFAENNDVILWWRPHPLAENHIKGVGSYYFDIYKKIVDLYKTSAYGIFDESPNLHRAIACADGYYGDKNSLLHLYAASGKPLILQKVTFDNRKSDNSQNIDNLKNVFFHKMPQTTLESLFHHENENLQLNDLYNFVLHGDYTQADILAQQKATIKIFGLPLNDLSGNLIYDYVKTEILGK